MFSYKSLKIGIRTMGVLIGILGMCQVHAADTIPVSEANYAEAETARNFRNWVSLGANKDIVHLRNLPPRGKKAATVQMNDDTLYSAAIVETQNGRVQFSIPEVDVYMSIQVVTEGGHGQHYVVGTGDYDLPVETQFAFLIYRTGTEKGLEIARAAQDEVKVSTLVFGTYEVRPYDYSEVEEWTSRLTAETRGSPFKYTFPRTSAEITDRHQWNLENANGWGGASPEVGVGNLYTNSVLLAGDKCLTTTFDDPESVYFTSITAYDADRYLLPDVRSINSYRWDTNSDDSITISFNCGDDAVNNINTHGQEFSFTVRFYGVSQKAIDGKVTPESNVR